MQDEPMTLGRHLRQAGLLALAASAALCLTTCQARAASFSIANDTPDFSQAAWTNYCAPTASADLVYHFGNTYASLLPAPLTDSFPAPIGSAVPNPDGLADGVINTLATAMGTTFGGGTTVAGLVSGLDGYLNGNSSASWTTNAIFAAGDPAFQSILENSLQNGAGVILLIEWPTGPPGSSYHQPVDPEPGTGMNDPIAHAMALVAFDTVAGTWGFNDPADNGSHLWPPVTPSSSAAIATGVGVDLTVSGTTGNVYGAVITQVVPEPGALLLLAGSLTALIALRRIRS
jgi:hypothetical protein